MKLQKMWKNIAIILLSVTLVLCGTVLFGVQKNNNTDDMFANGGSNSSTLATGTALTLEYVNNVSGSLGAGTYYLASNIQLTTYNITFNSEATLDLNGCTLTGNGGGSVITVNANFTLNDSKGNGAITGGNGITISSGTTNINGGTFNGKIVANGNVIVNGGYYNNSTLSGNVTIKGGYFSSGNTGNNTVVGLGVASGNVVVNLAGTTFDPDYRTQYPYAVYVSKGVNVELEPKNTEQTFRYSGVPLAATDLFKNAGEFDTHYVVLINSADALLLPKKYSFTSGDANKFVWLREMDGLKYYATMQIKSNFNVTIISSEDTTVTVILTEQYLADSGYVLGDGLYILNSDVTLSKTISIKGNATIDIKGRTLKGNGTANLFALTQDTLFTIKDSVGTGKIVGDSYSTSNASIINATNANSALVIEGGTLVDNAGGDTGKGAISSNGRVYLNGGTINGNLLGTSQATLAINGGYYASNVTISGFGTTFINGGYFATANVTANTVANNVAVASGTLVHKLSSTSTTMDSAYNSQYPYAVYTAGGTNGMSVDVNVYSTVYDGQVLDAQDFEFVVKRNGLERTTVDFVFEYKVGSEYVQGLPTNAGTYTIKVTAYYLYNGDVNYLYNVEKEYEYTITPKLVYVQWSNTTLTYNAENQVPTAMTTAEEGVVVAVNADGATIDSLNVGEYRAMVTFASGNYVASDSTKYINFVINPAQLTLEWGNTTGLEYTGAEVKPDATLVGLQGNDNVPVIVTVTSGGVNVKDTHIAVASIDNENYVLTGNNLTVQYTMAKKELVDTMFATIPTQMYTGGQITPTLIPLNNEPVVLGRDYIVTYGKNISGQGTVTVKVVADGNYSISYSVDDSFPLTFTITASLGDITITIPDVTTTGTTIYPNIFFGGKEYTPQELASKGFKLEWKNNAVVSTDTTQASLVITALDGSEYTGTTTCQFNILPIKLSIVWDKDSLTHIFDNTAYFPTYTVVGLLDDSYLPLFIDQSQVNAGDYSVTMKLAENLLSMYVLDEDTLTIEYRILPRELNTVWTTEFVYDGQEHFPTAMVDTGIEGQTVNLIIDGAKQINAGTYDIVVGVDNENYSVNNAPKQFTIAPKVITVVWNNTELVANGLAIAPIATVDTGVAGDLVALTVKGASSEVGEHTATAVMSAHNSNYVLQNETTSYTIKPNTLATTDNSANVSSNTGFDIGWKLSVEQTNSSVANSLPSGQKALAVYNVTLLDGSNAEVQPTGKVTVSIKLTAEQLQSNNLQVYYIDENGQAQAVASKVSGDSIVFETDHFSTYAIATTVQPVSGMLIFGSIMSVLIVGTLAVMIVVIVKRRND